MNIDDREYIFLRNFFHATTDYRLNHDMKNAASIEVYISMYEEYLRLNNLADNKEMKKFCSQGQQRMAVIALKMASIEILRKYDRVVPILLLDDVFSELDFEKRTNLFEYIYENVQTFITTTDLSNLNEELVKKAKIFKVENGNVVVSGEVK